MIFGCGMISVKCWSCGSVFVPTEMNHLPNFLCECGALNSNPFFNKKGFGDRFNGRSDWWSHSRSIGSL